MSKQSENDALVQAASEFGGVEVFMANARYHLAVDGANVPEADYRRLMSVNLDSGKTIFVSSVAAVRDGGSILTMGVASSRINQDE